MSNTKHKIAKMTKESFRQVVSKHGTMLKAAKELNMVFSTFKRYAIKYDCYNPNQSGKGEIGEERKSLNDVLSNKISIGTPRLKTKLWQLNIKKRNCENCGVGEEWKGRALILELHHKDGDNKNNRLSNLQILCPNCHSQTRNFRRRKRRAPKK